MAVYTVVKTIGTTSRQYSTLQAWEDGAPANLTTAEKSAATTFLTGTFTVGMSLTFVGSGATGKLLETDSTGPGTGTYIVYDITAGNPAASDTVTGTGGSPPTCVLTSGTADNVGVIWQGQCYNDSTFTANLVLSGSTSSASCYKELTTASGQSFRDNANVQTNALRYNTANGVSVGVNTNYVVKIIAASEDYARVSNLQIKQTGSGTGNCIEGSDSGAGNGAIFSNLICESNKATTRIKTGQIMKNCLLISTAASAVTSIATTNSGGSFYNCTLASIGSVATNGFSNSYAGARTVQNCGFFNATNATDGTGTYTFTTCATDIASPPSGCTTVAYSTSSGAKFQNITSGSHDFRIQSGSSMIDVGTTDSTNAANDIAGTARPSGSAYDIGCWEYVSAGGGGSGVVTFNPPLMGGFGHGFAAGMQG